MSEQEASLQDFTPQESVPEQNYITGFGSFPEAWSKQSIEDCASIRDSERIPLNKSERDEKKPGDIPYYGANGVVDYINEYIFNSELVLLAEDGGHFEEYQDRPVAYRISGKAWVNNHAHILEAKECIATDYLFYSLEHRNLVPYVSGSTRSKLTQTMLKRVSLPIPPLEEQHKIASVFYTIDQAIQKTEAIIGRLEKIKSGLLNTLFEHGYDDYSEYEEIRIGPFTYRKPSNWSITTIQEAKDGENGLRRGPFGGMLKKEIFVDEGYKVYQQQNVIYDDFVYGDYYITEEKYEDMKRFSVSSDDLLISCSGTLGKITKVPTDFEEGVINQALLKFSVDKELLDPKYVLYFLQSPIGQRQLVISARGSAMKNMAPMEFVRSTKLFNPPKREQEKIVNFFESLDQSIEAEEKRKRQLSQLKSGLMQDLLSGEVRTHNKDIEIVDKVLAHG